MKKLSLVLALVLMVSLFGACSGASNTPASSASSQPANNAAAPAPGPSASTFTGSNALEAVEWAAAEFPGAKAIKYANQTSTQVFEQNAGGLPALVYYLAKELPVRTEGRYRIELFADGTLAKSLDECISGLKSGAFDMEQRSTGNFGEYTTAFAEANVPFLFEDMDTIWKALKHGLQGEMEARAGQDIEGIMFKGITVLGTRHFSNNLRPVVTPADFSGMKIRLMSDPIQIAAFESMGASIVSIPYSELYTALQQKVVDGNEQPYQNFYLDKICEVQKYISVTNHLTSLQAQMISKQFYDSMSAEDQAIFNEVLDEAEAYGYEIAVETEAKYQELCKESGMEFTYLTEEQRGAFKTAMEGPVFDKCVELMGQERWDALNAHIAAVA